MLLFFSLSKIIFFYYLLICFLVSLIFVVLPIILSPKKADLEKISAYECGFKPIGNTRILFNIHYYILAILFIVFDIELIYILPWILSINFIGFYGIVSMGFFFFFIIRFLL